MKLFRSAFLVFILTCTCSAQVNSINLCRHGLNKPILSNSGTLDTISLYIPNVLLSIEDINVKIDTVEYGWDSDLRFELFHLSAADTLILHRGGSGDNFIGTNLNDSASTPIGSGTAPFTGTYRPDKPLSIFNNMSPVGIWVLRISSDAGGDTGRLKAWCLNIQYTYVTGINNNNSAPEKFELYQNYPNPFNPVTKIKFDISGSSAAQTLLTVYDMLGREAEVLINKELLPGTYEIEFDGSKYASGVYYYSLKTTGFTDVKKMVLIK